MENALRAGVMQHSKTFISSVFFTFFSPEIATESWRRGCWRWERKQGLFVSWVAISKAWHGDSDTGNNLKGACGLLPSDYFQGGFRCDNGKGKRDRPSPTQQLLDINTNIARAQPGNGVLKRVSATFGDMGYCSCLCTQQHLKKMPFTGD